MIEDIIDISIIGGGISGLYLSYKLNLEKYRKVSLFEATNYLGGRIKTRKYNVNDIVFLMELGAMRFEIGIQPYLEQLIKELNLSLIEFRPYSSINLLSGNSNYDIFLLWKNIIIKLVKNIKFPKHLIINDKEENSDIFKNINENHIEWIRNNGKIFHKNKEYLLYNIGIKDLLINFFSNEELNLIMKYSNFLEYIQYNVNSAELLIYWIRIFKTNKTIKTINNGVYEIIKSLVENINKRRIDINLLTKLINIEKYKNNYKLTFLNINTNETFCIYSKHIIFAIPPNLLEPFKSVFSKEIIYYINKIINIQLIKCFFIVNNKWWKNDVIETHKGSDKIPSREIHYFSNPNSNIGMVMIYCDEPTRSFWYKYRDNNILIKSKRENIFENYMMLKNGTVIDSYFYDWSIDLQKGAIY